MKLPYTLRPFQQKGVEFLLSSPYRFIADDMGLGKTVQLMAAAVAVGAQKVLIVSPKAIVPQLAREATKFWPELPVFELNPRKTDVRWHSAWVIVGGYEAACRHPQLWHLDYDVVIFDEAHYLKNPEAKRTQRLIRHDSTFLHRAKRVFLASGTPMLNRPAELFIYLQVFAPELLGVYANRDAYLARFCGWGGRESDNEDELRELIRPFFLRREKHEVLSQLPEVVSQEVPIPIPNPARFVAYEPAGFSLLAEEKIEGCIEYLNMLQQTVGKIFVVCYHISMIHALEQRFKNSRSIHGGKSHTQRERAVSDFIEDASVSFLIGQVQTVAFGIDGLQRVCDRVVFCEFPWSPGVLDQARDRLFRIGQKSKTVFLDLLYAPNTMDEQILYTLKNKRERIDYIMAKKDKAESLTLTPVLEQAVVTAVELIVKAVLEHITSHSATVPSTGGVQGPESTPVVLEDPILPGVDSLSNRISGLSKELLNAGIAQDAVTRFFTSVIMQGLSSSDLYKVQASELPIVLARLNTIPSTGALIRELQGAATQQATNVVASPTVAPPTPPALAPAVTEEDRVALLGQVKIKATNLAESLIKSGVPQALAVNAIQEKYFQLYTTQGRSLDEYNFTELVAVMDRFDSYPLTASDLSLPAVPAPLF